MRSAKRTEGPRPTRVSTGTSVVSQTLDCLARHAKDCPLRHRHGAELFVELNSRIIPVEDSPFETAALSLASNLGQLDEHRSAKTLAAHLRFHEKVFQIEAGPTEKRREIVEENGE